MILGKTPGWGAAGLLSRVRHLEDPRVLAVGLHPITSSSDPYNCLAPGGAAGARLPARLADLRLRLAGRQLLLLVQLARPAQPLACGVGSTPGSDADAAVRISRAAKPHHGAGGRKGQALWAVHRSQHRHLQGCLARHSTPDARPRRSAHRIRSRWAARCGRPHTPAHQHMLKSAHASQRHTIKFTQTKRNKV